jgi:hypothetical protein
MLYSMYSFYLTSFTCWMVFASNGNFNDFFLCNSPNGSFCNSKPKKEGVKNHIFSKHICYALTLLGIDGHLKKMFNLYEEKIFVNLATRTFFFCQGKGRECLFLFLTSGLAVFICLWLLVLPNSNNYSQFHKTVPKSSWQMRWISVRFYEMGDRLLMFFV